MKKFLLTFLNANSIKLNMIDASNWVQNIIARNVAWIKMSLDISKILP